MNLDIDSGEYAGKGLKYLTGTAPQGEGEIALSFLNASETGKTVGDYLTLQYQGETREFLISGVYQDVTSGGYTAKSTYPFPDVESNRYTISVNLKDPSQAESKSMEWAKAIGPGVSVDPMEDFIDQTLGGVTRQLRVIVLAIAIIGVAMVILITALFLKLRLAKDLSETAILKAIGFSARDIRKQYLIKMGGVSGGGILCGILVTHCLGSGIISGALSLAGMGIRKVELVTEPLSQYIAFPMMVLALILLVTWTVSGFVKKQHMISVINE
jgi:putative ABC transport system permease protein